jgi:hypothetical protein
MLAIPAAHSEPISEVRVLSPVDFCAAGVGGMGAGSGTIDVNCVSGTVTRAYLYWHGIDRGGVGAVYDNETVTVNGTPVTGTSLGDASTNCWGGGSSRAFEADVTGLISGNGSYAIDGLADGADHSGNGASLVVLFNDGNSSNDVDLAFFLGNDSNIPSGFPGEDDGWNASLPGINYGGGPVSVQLHVADGQSASDGDLTFTTPNGSETIVDTSNLYDGNTVPDAGTSRTTSGSLWDIHDLDITNAFGATSGAVTLDLSGQTGASDCLGLIGALISFEAGSVPPSEPPPGGAPAPAVPVPVASAKGLGVLAVLLLALGLLSVRRTS